MHDSIIIGYFERCRWNKMTLPSPPTIRTSNPGISESEHATVRLAVRRLSNILSQYALLNLNTHNGKRPRQHDTLTQWRFNVGPASAIYSSKNGTMAMLDRCWDSVTDRGPALGERLAILIESNSTTLRLWPSIKAPLVQYMVFVGNSHLCHDYIILKYHSYGRIFD